MKKMVVLLMALMLVFTVGSMTMVLGGPGPAPNSGDGIPDGSGWPDGQPGPFGPSEPAGATLYML
jgi:hypothetical protein